MIEGRKGLFFGANGRGGTVDGDKAGCYAVSKNEYLLTLNGRTDVRNPLWRITDLGSGGIQLGDGQQYTPERTESIPVGKADATFYITNTYGVVFNGKPLVF